MMSRAFHNVTARYNVYFNGTESYKAGLQKIEDSYIEDYSKLLPIFKYDDKNTLLSASSEMENAVKKSMKAIKKHSIKVKPKHKSGKKTDKQKEFEAKAEYCKWIDDSYLLMGKGHFYRMEHSFAIRAFKYILKFYPNSNITNEAQLWLAKTYIQKEEYENAQQLLNLIDADKTFSEKFDRDIELLKTDLMIKTNRHAEATTPLIKAIGLSKKKSKARLHYILAQLYLRDNNLKKASENFESVVALKPSYELIFNANINRSVTISGDENTEELVKQLHKMIKDDKNIDYQDQIYYALANIAFKTGDNEKAVEMYKKSVAVSVSNSAQKSLSYLALADIYYNKPVYDSAAYYYDSTMTLLRKDFENYDEVSRKASNLSALVDDLNVIHAQDSLQRMAKMSDKDRNEFINRTIQSIKNARALAKQREEELRRQMSLAQHEDNDMNQTKQKNSNWYFYNQVTTQRGIAEFSRQWGNRKLEDNWRRYDKSMNETTFAENDTKEESDTTKVKNKQLTDEDFDYYTKDIPTTEEEIELSDDKIIEAYFNIGMLYKEKLLDNDEAIRYFEKLIERYPKNKYLLTTYYSLYTIYNEKGDQSLAKIYRTKIISEFPNSLYAMIFTDPNFIKQLQANEKKVNDLYETAYNHYNNAEYMQVITIADRAETDYPKNQLAAKFEYLRAMSLGSTQGMEAIAIALSDLIQKYPGNEIVERAKESLKYLKVAIDLDKEKTMYKPSAEDDHLYLLVLKDKVNINQINFDINSHNLDIYPQNKFKVTNKQIDEKEVFLVEYLGNQEKAMQYFRELLANSKITRHLIADKYIHFVISKTNFDLLSKKNNYELYLDFFKQNYNKP